MWKWLIGGSFAALAGYAVAREYQKPADKRTWHGEMFGVIPYDFRAPSMDRMRERMWNPKDNHFFTPMWWGMGWSFNFGAVARWFGWATDSEPMKKVDDHSERNPGHIGSENNQVRKTA